MSRLSSVTVSQRNAAAPLRSRPSGAKASLKNSVYSSVGLGEANSTFQAGVTSTVNEPRIICREGVFAGNLQKTLMQARFEST